MNNVSSVPVNSSSSLPNRWLIAIAALIMQLSLGAVYAWSTFLNPVEDYFHAKKPEANLTFTITILALGITAGFGGFFQSRFGPRAIATVGGVLYGLGVFLAGFVPSSSLLLLYLTYGVIGGIGIGLAYIVPIAMLIKWFPDRRGFITGLAVAGFGAGSLIVAPIVTTFTAKGGIGLSTTFNILGIVYLIVVVGTAQFFRKAPDNYSPPGWTPSVQQKEVNTRRDFTLGEALRDPRWYLLWFILALNVTAGAALISVASDLAQKFTGQPPSTTQLIVGTIAIFNGAGRLFWGWLSDRIGRPYTFLTLFVIQIFVFLLLAQITDFTLILIPAAIIGLCYGGGFGTMPAFAADFFGSKNAGVIYGAMLTAWSAGAALGPVLIASNFNGGSSVADAVANYRMALYIIAGIMVVSAILPIVALLIARRAAVARENIDQNKVRA